MTWRLRRGTDSGLKIVKKEPKIDRGRGMICTLMDGEDTKVPGARNMLACILIFEVGAMQNLEIFHRSEIRRDSSLRKCTLLH